MYALHNHNPALCLGEREPIALCRKTLTHLCYAK